jgi:hypothetical protein
LIAYGDGDDDDEHHFDDVDDDNVNDHQNQVLIGGSRYKRYPMNKKMVRDPPRTAGKKKLTDIVRIRNIKETRSKLDLDFAKIVRDSRQEAKQAVTNLDDRPMEEGAARPWEAQVDTFFNDQNL